MEVTASLALNKQRIISVAIVKIQTTTKNTLLDVDWLLKQSYSWFSLVNASSVNFTTA